MGMLRTSWNSWKCQTWADHNAACLLLMHGIYTTVDSVDLPKTKNCQMYTFPSWLYCNNHYRWSEACWSCRNRFALWYHFAHVKMMPLSHPLGRVRIVGVVRLQFVEIYELRVILHRHFGPAKSRGLCHNLWFGAIQTARSMLPPTGWGCFEWYRFVFVHLCNNYYSWSAYDLLFHFRFNGTLTEAVAAMSQPELPSEYLLGSSVGSKLFATCPWDKKTMKLAVRMTFASCGRLNFTFRFWSVYCDMTKHDQTVRKLGWIYMNLQWTIIYDYIIKHPEPQFLKGHSWRFFPVFWANCLGQRAARPRCLLPPRPAPPPGRAAVAGQGHLDCIAPGKLRRPKKLRPCLWRSLTQVAEVDCQCSGLWR